jgi:hypothetical protein
MSVEHRFVRGRDVGKPNHTAKESLHRYLVRRIQHGGCRFASPQGCMAQLEGGKPPEIRCLEFE